MSKSYKRTIKGQLRDWLPGIFDNKFVVVGCSRRPRFTEKELEWMNKNPNRLKDIDDCFYWMKSPSWWNREFHTRPMRAKTRHTLRNIKLGKADPENTVWPLHNKPEKYYW